MADEVEFEKAFTALVKDRTGWNSMDVIRLARDFFLARARPEDGELEDVAKDANAMALRCYIAALAFDAATRLYMLTVTKGQDPGEVFLGGVQSMELGTLRGRGGAKV